MLPILSALLLLAVPQQSTEFRIAMTHSGRQVEVQTEPAAGALSVETPFGTFHTPTDPIEVILTRPAERPWEDAQFSFAGRPADWPAAEYADKGRLSDLVAFTEWASERSGDRGIAERLVAAVHHLEDWGRKLDPLPPQLHLDERAPLAWKLYRKDPSPRAALLLGRLLEEIPAGTNPYDARGPSLPEIRATLVARDPWLRRAAALVAARQGHADLSLAALLLQATIRDADPVARDGAALAASILWLDYTDNFWYETLMRAEEVERVAAASNLARYGGRRAVDYLVYGLSAWQQRTGKRFEFAGRDVQVVDRTREPGFPLIGARAGA
ncbi:MAG TPA: hypothetical protein VGC54_09905, partial [Planctomycetota bacterium]